MIVKGGFKTNQKVEVLDGVPIPRELYVDATDDSWPFDVHMIVRLAREQMKIHSVTFNVHEGKELESADLKIPMLRILRLGVASALGQLSFVAGRRPEKMKDQGPTEETLRFVAAIYRLALLAGHAPIVAVAETLDVPRPTAARWVEKAREDKYLAAAPKRQGGEKSRRKKR